jgi:hypothetical protein
VRHSARCSQSEITPGGRPTSRLRCPARRPGPPIVSWRWQRLPKSSARRGMEHPGGPHARPAAPRLGPAYLLTWSARCPQSRASRLSAAAEPRFPTESIPVAGGGGAREAAAGGERGGRFPPRSRRESRRRGAPGKEKERRTRAPGCPARGGPERRGRGGWVREKRTASGHLMPAAPSRTCPGEEATEPRRAQQPAPGTAPAALAGRRKSWEEL